MGYIPKFVYFSEFQEVVYPLGTHWNHEYIKQCASIIYDTFKEDFNSPDSSITLIARGTSGAMIAGAILSELKHINRNLDVYILISRKPNDKAHSGNLEGIEYINGTRLIVVDDFIDTGDTISAIIDDMDYYLRENKDTPIKKYDMLCISNHIDAKALKKNYNKSTYRKWKGICSRFDVVVCSPEYISKEEVNLNNKIN